MMFLAIVSSSWQTHVNGNPMYQFTTKLRLIKSVLKQLHHQHTSDIPSRVAQAREDWFAAQRILDDNPTSLATQNRIHRLTNEEGATITNPQEIRKTTISYYERLLTTTPNALPKDITSIYPNTISDATKLTTSLPITNEEIKSALFSIPDNKSPGPDGYNAFFFKQSWNIIGTDFIVAVKYFFSHNLLPRCVNATRVALVPKIENPTSMNDFRPISCCNVLYKCISKLIVIRLKAALAEVIGPSQSTFLLGR
ncbi:hypothetical protein NC652_022466 [Populus alba x Populus x berolinensis]|nr:hypothetical protein NC652_022466 [Populus alba x Populus x berolinensis]